MILKYLENNTSIALHFLAVQSFVNGIIRVFKWDSGMYTIFDFRRFDLLSLTNTESLLTVSTRQHGFHQIADFLLNEYISIKCPSMSPMLLVLNLFKAIYSLQNLQLPGPICIVMTACKIAANATFSYLINRSHCSPESNLVKWRPPEEPTTYSESS